ncbi:MAG: gamma-glutamyl-gamma-aminobutyrate hydrolase family protein [Gammaproteobacteria bacterium]
MASPRPLIGVICDRRMLGQHPYHLVEEKYLEAVVHGAAGLPLCLPVLAGGCGAPDLPGRLDGLLLTGSPSNVEPARYQREPERPDALHDPQRDALALALIPAAVEAGLPVLAICRGFQEMNVAFGGTLYQALPEVAGLGRHRAPAGSPLEERYAPSHAVRFTPGGLLARISGRQQALVNSVHSQGVERLADALAIEAVAPDGLVEACVVRDAPGFTLAVQWHPEWNLGGDALSQAIFRAFGEAARRYAAR